MTPSAAHSALVRQVLAELGAMPGVVIGGNPSGRARYVTEDGHEFAVPYGWPAAGEGGPDILAAVAPLGRLVALEVKTGNAQPTAAQKRCHAALRSVGVEIVIVRSVDDARAAIERVRGASSL